MEIIVAIAIIGIVAAIAVPAVRAWIPNHRLKKAAWDLYSALHQARLEAVEEHKDRAVFFNTGNDYYRVLTDPGQDGNWGTADDEDDNPGQDGDHSTTADNIPEKPRVNLRLYGNEVSYGHPGGCSGACPSADGAGFDDDVTFGDGTIDNMVIFDSEGMLSPSSGYVYIKNELGSCYAIGALTSGAIFMRRWFQGNESWG